MWRVPCASSTTRPADLSNARWRDTAGRLMGNSSAMAPTDRPPAPRRTEDLAPMRVAKRSERVVGRASYSHAGSLAHRRPIGN